MTGITINHWAVLVSAVVAMAIGAFWFSPIAFGKVWMRLSGITEPKNPAWGFFFGFISMVVMSYALAVSVHLFVAETPLSGALVGAGMWLGFIAPVTLGMVIWENKPFGLYLISSGYYLIAFIVMGTILSVIT